MNKKDSTKTIFFVIARFNYLPCAWHLSRELTIHSYNIHWSFSHSFSYLSIVLFIYFMFFCYLMYLLVVQSCNWGFCQTILSSLMSFVRFDHFPICKMYYFQNHNLHHWERHKVGTISSAYCLLTWFGLCNKEAKGTILTNKTIRNFKPSGTKRCDKRMYLRLWWTLERIKETIKNFNLYFLLFGFVLFCLVFWFTSHHSVDHPVVTHAIIW